MRFSFLVLAALLTTDLPPTRVPTVPGSGSDCRVEQGSRDALLYDSATNVRFARRHAVMAGFRFRGTYSKGCAPVFAMPADRRVSIIHDLGAERRPRFENWYAIFAAANDGETEARATLMPFLRVGSVERGVVTFMAAGENGSGPAAYDWHRPNILAGADILVISENGGFSGRVTKVLASNGRTLALQDGGSLSRGDFLLPAPPEHEHYLYLGTFYLDTKEVRNLYDSGVLVKARMAGIYSPTFPDGAVGGIGARISLSGYISPLATAAVFESSGGLSTASIGQYVEYFDPDGGGHVVDTRVLTKSIPTTEAYLFSDINVPFLYHQLFFFRNDGPLAPSRIESRLHVTGWIEP